MKIVSRFLVVLSVLIFVISCKKNDENRNEKPPNILFIFPDQLRNAAIGINKQDPVITPNLDKLGKEGMVISNAISNYPLCSPYRGMLMTGKLPYNNSVLSNSNSNRYKYNNSWQKGDISISDVLVKNGYDAGYVGKLHLTSPAPIQEKDTVIWDAYQPKELRHGFNFWYAYGTFDQHNTPHYWINDAKENEVTEIKEWSAKHEADVIIDYIKNPSKKTRDKDKPFALFWSVNPPHPPYQYVPEKYLENYTNKSLDELLVRENVALDSDASELAFHAGATRKRTHLAKEHVRNHFAMVTGVDDQIGRVLKALKEEGLEENTIVVITSDHGEMMGSHGLMSKNVWFEEAINVPFIIKWPKKIKANQKSDLIVSTTDIMPTLLNLVEATEGIPTNIDGRDLSSLLLNKEGDKPTSALYYFILEGQPASGHRGIRTNQHTYVITIDEKNIERKFLYDNVNDPYQKTNLIGRDDILEKKIHEELLKSLKEKKDPWLEKYQTIKEQMRRKNTGAVKAKGKTPKETEGNFASAWIDHGFAPKNANYQYVIYPFNSQKEIRDFDEKVKKDTSYTILRADNTAHIVKNLETNTTGYVVFEADENLENGILKSVSKPALVMARKNSDNAITLSVVEPDLNFPEGEPGKYKNYSQATTLKITLNGKWTTPITPQVLSVDVTIDATIISLELKDGLPVELKTIKR